MPKVIAGRYKLEIRKSNKATIADRKGANIRSDRDRRLSPLRYTIKMILFSKPGGQKTKAFLLGTSKRPFELDD